MFLMLQGVTEAFTDVLTGKINTISTTISGIKSAVKGIKRGTAIKLSKKIEGFGDFVTAITKGLSTFIDGIVNAM
jgi:phage-related protein